MKKKFTQEEVKFLYEHLRHLIQSEHGCQIPGTDIICPHWQPVTNPGDDFPGQCMMKKSNRVCTKLELPLVDEGLVLEVRDKHMEDYLQELDEELQLCKAQAVQVTKQMKELNADRQTLQSEIEKLEKRKERLLHETKDV